MSSARYIAVESAISVLINVALSVTFVLLVFGARDSVELRATEVIMDMVPQSFMVTFMGTLVPTLFTRRRIAKGQVTPSADLSSLPRNVLLRALVLAVPAALACTGLYALIAPDAAVRLPAFALAKACFGAVLAAIVTPLALRAALRDKPRQQVDANG